MSSLFDSVIRERDPKKENEHWEKFDYPRFTGGVSHLFEEVLRLVPAGEHPFDMNGQEYWRERYISLINSCAEESHGTQGLSKQD